MNTTRRKPQASPDLIADFQRMVREADGYEEKIEFPTCYLVPIANVLDHVHRPHGRPPKTGRFKVREAVAYAMARGRISDLKSQGVPAREALEREARQLKKSPAFSKLSLATIKDRLQRSGSGRRSGK